MLTGTFLGTMISSAAVVLTFVLLQPYVYWKFIADKSHFVKMIYVVMVNATAGLLAILFSYRLEENLYLDTRLAPVLITMIGGVIYPPIMPVLTALMIAGLQYLIAPQHAFVSFATLMTVSIVMTTLNIWIRHKSLTVRLWTHSILGNALNVLILGVVGVGELDVFIREYALMVFATGAVTTALMAMMYEMLYTEVRRRSLLQATADTDHLTGLSNRRAIDEYLAQQIECVQGRGEDDLTLAILDIDFFKRVNDTYGHEVGDQVLKKVALIMQESVRSSDLAGRYGGEEFVIIFPFLSKKVAYEIIERIRHKIEKTQFPIDSDRKISITISAGLASLSETGDRALKVKADQRLYLAKTQGRNRSISEGE